MTRLAVLSDIHGNLPALEAVLADLARDPVDQIIVAGDTISAGPFSAQVMDRLYDLGATMIRGNHEYYMLDHQTPRQPEAWSRYITPAWLNAQLPAHWKRRIAGLPDAVQLRYADAPPALLIHGLPGNPWTGLYPSQTDAQMADLLAGVAERTVIAGHTHLVMERWVNDIHVINPGSVGAPLDGVSGARYAVLEGNPDGWRATFRLLSVDLTPLLAEFERAGFVEQYGALAFLMVEEFKVGRPLLYAYNRWKTDMHPKAPDSMALARHFLTLDPELYESYLPPDYRRHLIARR